MPPGYPVSVVGGALVFHCCVPGFDSHCVGILGWLMAANSDRMGISWCQYISIFTPQEQTTFFHWRWRIQNVHRCKLYDLCGSFSQWCAWNSGRRRFGHKERNRHRRGSNPWRSDWKSDALAAGLLAAAVGVLKYIYRLTVSGECRGKYLRSRNIRRVNRILLKSTLRELTLNVR